MSNNVFVNQLTEFIQNNLNDENAGRVALYHYLKNFCRDTENVLPPLINRFYSECLQMTYWQEKKNELHADIKDLLTQFYSAHRVAISMEALWDLTKVQVLSVGQIENLYACVRNYENLNLSELETLRLIPDGETKIVSLKKNSSGQIKVHTFNNQARIEGHQLFPLAPDQELYYNPLLELQTHIVQRLKLTPHLQVRFEINDDGVIAQSISGFAFRQSQILKLSHLGEFPALFYHLKRLERFYVFRGSDPYYVELISTLNKALQLLQNGEAGAENFARHVFESAQIAFDQVFSDDKALYVKLKELAKVMAMQKMAPSRKPEEVSI